MQTVVEYARGLHQKDIACNSSVIGYSEYIENPEQVMHMFLEDMPDLVSRVDELHEAGIDSEYGTLQTQHL